MDYNSIKNEKAIKKNEFHRYRTSLDRKNHLRFNIYHQKFNALDLVVTKNTYPQKTFCKRLMLYTNFLVF